LSILRYDYLQLHNSATANNLLATNPIKENPRMEMPMELSLEQQFMLNVYKMVREKESSVSLELR
jgi:hypothetical protein